MTALALTVAPELLAAFQLDAERLTAAFLSGRNGNTIAAYRRDLEDFRAFIGAVSIEAAGQALIAGTHGTANALGLAYRSHMVDRQLQPTTINRRLAALRSLVKLANVVGLVPWRLDVESIKTTPYRDTRGPGLAAYRAMLVAAAAQPSARAARDVAILRLLHDVGLRRGELVGLDLEHVDLDGARVLVLGKARSQRESITLPAPTRAALSTWLAVRGAAPGPLFASFDRSAKGSGRLTGDAVWRIVGAYGTAAGAKVRPHGLRHLAITSALDAGADIRKVQRFSRHKDVRVLAVYDDNRSDLGGEVAGMVAALV